MIHEVRLLLLLLQAMLLLLLLLLLLVLLLLLLKLSKVVWGVACCWVLIGLWGVLLMLLLGLLRGVEKVVGIGEGCRGGGNGRRGGQSHVLQELHRHGEFSTQPGHLPLELTVLIGQLVIPSGQGAHVIGELFRDGG